MSCWDLSLIRVLSALKAVENVVKGVVERTYFPFEWGSKNELELYIDVSDHIGEYGEEIRSAIA